MINESDVQDDLGVAIVGISGRFPGADNVDELWKNLCSGVESISRFGEHEIDPSIDRATVRHSDYVSARGIVRDADRFDAEFFGVTPREAQIMDPQQRLCLEASWSALESAGYVPDEYQGAIGVYAGMANNTYFPAKVASRQDLVQRVGEFQTMLANEKDFLATRIAYLLGLTGPSISMYTGCSTSLVAVCNAYHGLLSYQCDLALAGGATLFVPQKSGYLWHDGGIQSRDGTCRPFDGNASGTVFSEGVAVVLLKRLQEAVQDGDQIYAVIRGAAMNNDGSAKQSFAAPSVAGQASVISMAHAEAGVDAASIGYVETHGTATQLGDAVEIEALELAFGDHHSSDPVCIGSIKSNLGHLLSTAGVAGLIKAALVLKHGVIPPTLHFEEKSESGDGKKKFFVNSTLQNWPDNYQPRRAGVSSFGIGGTNAHVVMEEPPAWQPEKTSSRPRHGHLIMLSAKSEIALDLAAKNLADHLQAEPNVDLADVTYTLQAGRKAFSHRRSLVVSDMSTAVDALRSHDSKRDESQRVESAAEVVFAFPGQGTQFEGMGRTLYESEPVYRETMDECVRISLPLIEVDLVDVLFGGSEHADLLDDVAVAPIALIATEYALAKLWQSWGVDPDSLVGHSSGEFTAACLAGVFSIEDLVTALCDRGRVLRRIDPGQMIAVGLSAVEMTNRLPVGLSLAADNAPNQCLVSGPSDAMDELKRKMDAEGISYLSVCSRLAYHSAMLDDAISETTEIFSKIKLSAPQIPLLSAANAEWITAETATDPSYWANNMRSSVRFREAIDVVLDRKSVVVLEVGPGSSITSCVRRATTQRSTASAVDSMGESAEKHELWMSLWQAIGKLWLSGATIDWEGVYTHQKRRRVKLPTYPFARTRYWIDDPESSESQPISVEKGASRNVPELPADSSSKRTMPLVSNDNGPENAKLAQMTSSDIVQIRQKELGRDSQGSKSIDPNEGIAIIGMAGRFPGAQNTRELWKNLVDGNESIKFFSDEELATVEHDYEKIRNDPQYIRARGVIDNIEEFDSQFFGFNPMEARLLDPQHRVWFECAWEALEDAGCDPSRFDGLIGVFAGSGYLNSYLLHNLCKDRAAIDDLVRLRGANAFHAIICNDKDFLPTRTSHLFDLHGPSINVQTACSTSLVAVAQACQSLVLFESDVCLAGGISIQLPQCRGYLAQTEGMDSPDGHCRVFDSKAGGTVFSNGSGVVVLRRLKDALADNDHIYAVIKGWAVNNDGAQKQSYVGPNPQSQAEVVAAAHLAAGFDADTISYVEAHGTATQVGDPIEIAALTNAFRRQTDRRQFCGIGSVKSNIGHLDSAAGVAGLIKTAMAMKNQKLPPSLNYEKPNPQIDFDESPFYVVDRLTEWKQNATAPRRAGVSSFGVGGTNVHVVLEEAPCEVVEPDIAREWQLITLSARTDTALANQAVRLSTHLQHQSPTELADAAFTLHVGRKQMQKRQFVVCQNSKDAEKQLKELTVGQTGSPSIATPQVVFMFPGQGSQFVNMAHDLYASEPKFRESMDASLRILQETEGLNLADILYPSSGESEQVSQQLRETRYAQPALFTVEYAYAQLLREWGVSPESMIGHSVGEYTAACLAGVFSLEDVLSLLVARGSLMQKQPPGQMLAVPMSEAEVQPYLGNEISLAATNAPEMTVVSGTCDAITRLDNELNDRGVSAIVLQTSHAFHSPMMNDVVTQFAEVVEQKPRNAPSIPFVSNLTGDWITDEQAQSAEYWIQQLRQPVRFCQGIECLIQDSERLLLEVGPGTALTTLARRQLKESGSTVVSCSGRPNESKSDVARVLEAVGELWNRGVDIDWKGFHENEARTRVGLPTYPFERHRFWVEPPKPDQLTHQSHQQLHQEEAGVMAETSQNNAGNSDSDAENQVDLRCKHLEALLIETVRDLSGIELDDSDAGAPFVELGMDSLFLTQFSTTVKNEFGVVIKFRRLMEDIDSVAALAAHLDQNLAADDFMPPKPDIVEPTVPIPVPSEPQIDVSQTISPVLPPVAPAATAPSTENGSVNELIIQQQLALMAKQVELLSGVRNVHQSPTTSVPNQESNLTVSQPTSAIPTSPQQQTPPKPPTPSDPESQPAEETTPSLVKKPFGASARIDTSKKDELPAEQSKFLRDLIRRYSERTRKSKQFTQLHRRHMSDPRAVSGFTPLWKEIVYPIVVDRSLGAKLWDLDGNEYIDLTCGFGSNFLGNSPPFIVAAIARQLEAGYEVGPQHPLAGEVAELMQRMTGMDRVAFCNTGSEAVMGAVRAARTVTGRKTVVIFANAYHGICDEVIVRAGHKLRSVPAAPGIPFESVENILVLDYGSDEALKVIRERASELAAVLVEPVQSRRPLLQPAEFLHELRKLTKEKDVPLIFDEVITGFRISQGGAQEYFGVRADLATYGKIIGGGLPFAAIAGSPQYMDALDGGYWEFGDESYPEAGVTYFAGTFVRHPLALAAAKASLEHLLEEGPELQQRLNARTESFVAELNGFFKSVAAPVELTNFGSLCRVSVSDDVPYGSLFYYLLREKGVHIWEGFGCFLTTAHDDEDIAKVVKGFKQCVTELQDSRFFPGKAGVPKAAEVNGSYRENRNDSSLTAPLTDPQKEVWFASQMSATASTSYNESFAIQLRGLLDVDVLREAIGTVTRRHDALNVRFGPESDPHMHMANQEPDIRLVDATDSSTESDAENIRKVYQSEAQKEFDLERGPMIRFVLIKSSSEFHTLVTTSHHIVFDGWSGGIFVEELGVAYSARVNNQAVRLEDSPSFLAYAEREVECYAGADYEESVEYWKNTFSDGVPVLNLPCDRPRPAVKTYKGATVHWEFPPSLFQSLKKLAARQGTTVFTLMLSTFNVLLHRLTGQNDLVVGIPIAGQALYDEEWLVGHCANIIPVRMETESNVPFDDFVQSMKTRLLDAREHQQCTLGSILKEVAIDRDPGRSPLIEVLFNLNRELPQCSMQGLEVILEEIPKAATNWDLFLDLDATEEEFSADCDFNTDIFDSDSIERWMGYFQMLLEEIVAGAGRTLGDLPMLPKNERDKILTTWNDTLSRYPSELCVQDLIDRQTDESPSRFALSDRSVTLTYRELQVRSNRIANHLVSLGTRPGDKVGVFMEKSAETVCVLLGILRCGATYVPLDITFPEYQNEQRCGDAGLSILVTEKARAGLAPHCSTTVVIDQCNEELDKQEEIHKTEMSSGDLAYVLYTSGSEGKPKGVEVSHRALTNFLCSMKAEPGMTQNDVMLSVTTLSFDIAALEIYLPLLCGGHVVIADRETSSDGRLMAEAMDQYGVTIMQATPSMWQLLLQSGWPGRTDLKMLCGGEALPQKLAYALVEKGDSLWNLYGPTETTIWSSIQRVAHQDLSISIGRPIANTQFYILDEQLRPQPIGVPGMLYIAGDGLAEGYIGRPTLTAERFIDCPFKTDARMYKTGDLARYLPDGRVECLGRVDSQIKLRGFRIELGEIESALGRAPAVRQCTVAVRDDANDKAIVAYVTLQEGFEASTSEFHRFLQQFVPDYMIPTHFVVLDELPLSPSGKVDRKALPVPDALRPNLIEVYEPPQTVAQKTVCNVWREILSVERVGIHDNFFELGGHSILVVQSVVKLRDVFGSDIPLGLHFEAPTVRRLCERLHDAGYLPADIEKLDIPDDNQREQFFI